MAHRGWVELHCSSSSCSSPLFAGSTRTFQASSLRPWLEPGHCSVCCFFCGDAGIGSISGWRSCCWGTCSMLLTPC